MVYKLGMCAQKRWRKISKPEMLTKLVNGSSFQDGTYRERRLNRRCKQHLAIPPIFLSYTLPSSILDDNLPHLENIDLKR